VRRDDGRGGGRVRRRATSERGSALLLVPAGFVALLVLAAVAVDQSMLFAARRQLIDVAASAANDAAAVAVDEAAYRGSGGTPVTSARAEAGVAAALAARGMDDVLRSVTVTDGPDGPEVVVRLETELHSVFARLAPGGYGQVTIRVAASATLDTF
jgi:hypothetical protein